MSISETSVKDAEMLAIDEIYEAGGVMGKKIEPIVEDGASDWPTFAEKATKLIQNDQVATVFGCWTSARTTSFRAQPMRSSRPSLAPRRGSWSARPTVGRMGTRDGDWRTSRTWCGVGRRTGSCPHAAVRDDPSMNLAAVAELSERFPDLDYLLLESGGDNLTLTFSPSLVDFTIYVADVAGGDKIPRKRGAGLMRSDLLVINKFDLAPYVGADLDVMARDAAVVRNGRLTRFTNCRTGEGIADVVSDLIGAADTFLEYWPEPTILYSLSSLSQEVSLVASANATLIFRDILMPGRIARGEAFQFTSYTSLLQGYSEGGELLFCDAFRLDGGGLCCSEKVGRFGSNQVLGSMIVFSPECNATVLCNRIAERFTVIDGALAGVTELPDSAGIMCRALGPTASAVDTVLRFARDAAVHGLAQLDAAYHRGNARPSAASALSKMYCTRSGRR